MIPMQQVLLVSGTDFGQDLVPVPWESHLGFRLPSRYGNPLECRTYAAPLTTFDYRAIRLLRK